MASQQTLEIVDQLIAHYSHPVAVGQITTGTIQSKSPEEYALQALNTTALLLDIGSKSTPGVNLVVGLANLGFDKDIFSANQNSGVTMNIGKVTSSLSDIANMVTGGVGVYATLTGTVILSPEVIVGIAATGLTLGAASLATGNTNIDVTGIKNNLADILENTVGQFEGGINALMNNWQQYQDSGQSPLGFILDTGSQLGGTMKTTGLSLSLSDLEEHNIKISDVTGVFSINNATFVNSVNGGSVNSNIILTSGMAVYDPLILDLDGDGVETVGLDSKVLFDHAADGTKNATGWVGKDDGLLVRDINNNGTIDTGRELLGDNTILNNGQKAKNAYEALADLDSNKDGILNNQDAKYSELKVWQDANQDGISQSNELKTLQDAGIASLKVSPTNTTTTTLINGNSQAATSTYTKIDGTIGISAGINFAGDEFVREFTTKVDTSQVASLPDMQASGSVRDLREAAALSSDLATKLQTYANSTNRTSTDLDSLVKTWASTSNMQTLASGLKPGGHPVGGRGTNLTQEEIYKLNVIEKFTGYYGGVVNFKDPAADLANGRYSGTFLGIQLDAAAINKNYDQLLQSVDTSIAIQTNFKDSMNDVLFKFNNTGVTVDFSNLYAKVNGSNPSQVVGDITKLYTYFKNNGGDLFPASSQTEMLNWIKDRIVKDGVDPSKVNSNFEQIGFATSVDDLIITSAKSSDIMYHKHKAPYTVCNKKHHLE